MKGFFFVILILFSFQLHSNVFISPVQKLSPAVIQGIKKLKIYNGVKAGSTPVSQNLKETNTNKQFCFKFSKNITGGFFSPTKSFNPVIILKTQTHY